MISSGLDHAVDLVHAVVGNSDLLSAQVKIRHVSIQGENNNGSYNCSMSQWNVPNQPCCLLVALLAPKDCRKVVHELYVRNEIRQEFFFCGYDLWSWIIGI